MAATAVSRLPNAVITTTGVSVRLAATQAATSSPEVPGMFRSTTIASKSASSSSASAASPDVRDVDLEAPRLRKPGLQQRAHLALVVDRPASPAPAGAHAALRGRNIENRLPRPGALSACDPAAVLVDDVVGHRQTEPRRFADRLGGEEGLEHARQHVGRHARPVVAHRQLESPRQQPAPSLVRPALAAHARGSQRHVDRPASALAWMAFTIRLVRACCTCVASAVTGADSTSV